VCEAVGAVWTSRFLPASQKAGGNETRENRMGAHEVEESFRRRALLDGFQHFRVSALCTFLPAGLHLQLPVPVSRSVRAMNIVQNMLQAEVTANPCRIRLGNVGPARSRR